MTTSDTVTEYAATLRDTIAKLTARFEAERDVTAHEFMQLSEARDELTNLIRRMYETCFNKDD